MLHSWSSFAFIHECICADLPATFTFRLLKCGGPYIRSGAYTQTQMASDFNTGSRFPSSK